MIKSATQYFLYSDEGLIGEYDALGTELKAYGWKPGSTWTTDPLFLRENGQVYFYHNDHLGTPQKLTSVSGAVVWKAVYNAFGDTLVDPASTVTSNLRFAGQYFDQETSLHYNYHRYYDPATGRYLTPDPIGFEGGINLYNYTSNNSINATDPHGLDTWSGAFDEADTFIIFGGRSEVSGFIYNWNTGEKCYFNVTCYKIGIGLLFGASANSQWMINGPECGNDLAGDTIGMGGDYLSPSITGGVDKNGAVTVTGGAGEGPKGAAMYAFRCVTKIKYCDNTPKNCKCNK